MTDIRDLPPVVLRRIAELPYERAIVEKQLFHGQRALRVFPVDGTEILHEDGHPVPCWNTLTVSQQRTLIDGHYGEPIRTGFAPSRLTCTGHASVLIEMVSDETPGPRFYCLPCAGAYLAMKVVTK